MPQINHIHYATDKGEVYCCLRNRVVRLDEDHRSRFCSSCKMYNGDAGGRGVECLWDDLRDVSDPHLVTDPHKEWAANQKRKDSSYPDTRMSSLAIT
ncbi:hypothetical protein [Paenibacillus sp. J2TS4]|uniref:hypothetical protein n=1 Tax=Paenibacillus sp. J2TS4 TaxID=2807194 RepID=UPI001B0CB39A|nr:hypothetical protein [Paenibacillus sp. J2TS4]GIP35415.1 hypothetical protein J2TS4_46250 [Paenibacillus sp. J2TS4]